MNFEQHALILAVIESLHRHGSWTGKTHVQKALSLLRDRRVACPFQFVLYKHGPYSFDVETALEQMKSYGAVEVEPNAEGYGVVLKPGSMSGFVKSRAAISSPTQDQIEGVCSFIGARNVLELERLATASWIRRQERIESTDEVARRLNTLKPHVSLEVAARADRELMNWQT